MPKVQLGEDNFKSFCQSKAYYVDKSLMINEVVNGSKVQLLPRPRRFGKTLNLSMLRYFFEKSDADNRPLFDDLAVTGNPDLMAHLGQYPVISLGYVIVKGVLIEF